jgi:hypothetical protein
MEGNSTQTPSVPKGWGCAKPSFSALKTGPTQLTNDLDVDIQLCVPEQAKPAAAARLVNPYGGSGLGSPEQYLNRQQQLLYLNRQQQLLQPLLLYLNRQQQPHQTTASSTQTEEVD